MVLQKKSLSPTSNKAFPFWIVIAADLDGENVISVVECSSGRFVSVKAWDIPFNTDVLTNVRENVDLHKTETHSGSNANLITYCQRAGQ